MKKKLYQVEITVMVLAESENEAINIAVSEATQTDCEVYEASSVPSEWWDSIPFGSDDNETCGAILKRQREQLSVEGKDDSNI